MPPALVECIVAHVLYPNSTFALFFISFLRDSFSRREIVARLLLSSRFHCLTLLAEPSLACCAYSHGTDIRVRLNPVFHFLPSCPLFSVLPSIPSIFRSLRRP